MNKEEKEEIISNYQKKIIQYIFDNPHCIFKQIKDHFKGEISLNQLKWYLRGMYKENRTIYEKPYLIEKGHVINHREIEYGKNKDKYPEEFIVNPKFYDLYPEIRRKINFEKLHSFNRNDLDDPMIQTADFLLPFLIIKNYEVEIDQELNTKPFYLSNKMGRKFYQLIDSIIYDCFINNPDLWYCFENPEDLSFTIKIEFNEFHDPNLFEYFKRLREFELEEKYLNDNYTNPLSSWILDKKERQLEYDKIDLYYAKAKLECEDKPYQNKEEFIEKQLDPAINPILKKLKEKDYDVITFPKEQEQDK